MNQTAQMAIEAYGGPQLGSEAAGLEAEFGANGLAFTLKRRQRKPVFHLKATGYTTIGIG